MIYWHDPDVYMLYYVCRNFRWKTLTIGWANEFIHELGMLENYFRVKLSSGRILAITLSSGVEIKCRQWRLKLDIPRFNLR